MTEIHPNFRLNGCFFSKESLLCWAMEHELAIDDFLKDAACFLLQWFDERDTILVQTSGTTGTPKSIEISKQAMICSAKATGFFFNLTAGIKALCCLPVKYIAGKMMLVRALVLGWQLDIVSPSSRPLENTSTFYDFVAMVPLQVKASLSHLEKVNILLIGGAPLDKSLTDQLLLVDCTVYESYSMTETVTHVALKKLGERYFTALPEVFFEQDERSCLVIKAPLLCSEILITNDVVKLLSPQTFIWQGRVDYVINSGGVKLFPERIEQQLAPFIQPRFFIAGIPDVNLGECVALFIEGESYSFSSNSFKKLARYEVPKHVFFVPYFEETETGKVKRKAVVEKCLKG